MRPTSRFLSALLLAALCAGTLLGPARPAAAKDSLAALELEYLSLVRRTDELGYAAQAKALERIADLRTQQAREKLQVLLDAYGELVCITEIK